MPKICQFHILTSSIVPTSSQFILPLLQWLIAHQVYHNTLLIPITRPSNPSSNCFQENLSESHSWSNHSQILKSFRESLITYRINNSLARHGKPYVLIFFLIPNFSLQMTFQASTVPCFLCYWKDPYFHSLLGMPSFHCLLSSLMAPTLFFFFKICPQYQLLRNKTKTKKISLTPCYRNCSPLRNSMDIIWELVRKAGSLAHCTRICFLNKVARQPAARWSLRSPAVGRSYSHLPYHVPIICQALCIFSFNPYNVPRK